MKTFKICF